MKRSFFFWLVVISTLLSFSFAQAQQRARSYRIGFLSNASGIRADYEEIVRHSLREIGFIEGQNIEFEWRFSKANLDLLPKLAQELVRLNPDCIIASGVAPTKAVKETTATIPIVMANADDDPVRQGLVASLARPGGNVTGFTNIGSELAGKRLELLKEILPRLSRVAIFADSRGEGGAGHVRESQIAAPALGIQLLTPEIHSAKDLDKAFETAVKGHAAALLVIHTGLMNSQINRVVSFALKTRLPATYSTSRVPPVGGLMSYDTDANERFQGVASYVAKILSGTKPRDLPVQRPKKFEFIINLKTANQIGLVIPPNVLVRADRVIR